MHVALALAEALQIAMSLEEEDIRQSAAPLAPLSVLGVIVHQKAEVARAGEIVHARPVVAHRDAEAYRDAARLFAIPEKDHAHLGASVTVNGIAETG